MIVGGWGREKFSGSSRTMKSPTDLLFSAVSHNNTALFP